MYIINITSDSISAFSVSNRALMRIWSYRMFFFAYFFFGSPCI